MLLVFSEPVAQCNEVLTVYYNVDSYCCYLKTNHVTILLMLAKSAPSFKIVNTSFRLCAKQVMACFSSVFHVVWTKPLHYLTLQDGVSCSFFKEQ